MSIVSKSYIHYSLIDQHVTREMLAQKPVPKASAQASLANIKTIIASECLNPNQRVQVLQDAKAIQIQSKTKMNWIQRNITHYAYCAKIDRLIASIEHSLIVSSIAQQPPEQQKHILKKIDFKILVTIATSNSPLAKTAQSAFVYRAQQEFGFEGTSQDFIKAKKYMDRLLLWATRLGRYGMIPQRYVSYKKCSMWSTEINAIKTLRNLKRFAKEYGSCPNDLILNYQDFIKGQLTELKFLLHFGLSPDAKAGYSNYIYGVDFHTSFSLIETAILWNDLELLELALKHGASLDKGNHGTPLSFVLNSSMYHPLRERSKIATQAYDILCKHGAKPNANSIHDTC